MPWRGPQQPGEFPTLGYLVVDFIESSCAVPDGDRAGDKLLLTDEQVRWCLWFYRLRPDAREDRPSEAFHFTRGGVIVRPQKWGKGPLAAANICAEAEGPVRFAGWDANGDPVGRPWGTPLIQITAVSEEQTGNVFQVLRPMIEWGGISADIPDTGETRIMLPGGGRIVPITASAPARLGQRTTFVVQDQTESYFRSNKMRAVADTQRRNLAGMGGRFMSTPNAWDPAQDSVAEADVKEPGVYVDDVEPGNGSIRNKAERRRMLRKVYGDSWVRDHPEPERRVNGWVSLDRIEEEIEALLPRDPAQAERWFLNRKRASEGAAFDPDQWGRLVAQRAWAGSTRREWATLGFDGAKFHDATGLIATHVATGWQWVQGAWEKPEDVTDDDWEVDEGSVHDAVERAFDEWRVWRMYADPPWWEEAIARWQGRFGVKRVLEWWTNRDKAMAFAVLAFRQAMYGETPELSHDGNPIYARHIANARKRETLVKDDDGRYLSTIQKEAPKSPRKIDLAVAGCLSWEARRDAIAAGILRRQGGSGVTF